MNSRESSVERVRPQSEVMTQTEGHMAERGIDQAFSNEQGNSENIDSETVPPKPDRPKGILKSAREKFPEDPNPIREGVAPLKTVAEKGIPVSARWTKVDRMLVNPEALQIARERFEVQDNYVIILRVLTRDEIMKLEELTRQIRGEFHTKSAQFRGLCSEYFSGPQLSESYRLCIYPWRTVWLT